MISQVSLLSVPMATIPTPKSAGQFGRGHNVERIGDCMRAHYRHVYFDWLFSLSQSIPHSSLAQN